MKTANDIYNATYHKDSYNAIRTAIDALKKPNSQERTNALIDIQDMARRLSEPFYATQELYADPILVKHWSALMDFGYDNGLSMDVIKDIRRYLNRFRAAALAEGMQIKWQLTPVKHLYEITAPISGYLSYVVDDVNGEGSFVRPYIQWGNRAELEYMVAEWAIDTDEAHYISDPDRDMPFIKRALADIAELGLNLFTF